jgi:hypothetical protein
MPTIADARAENGRFRNRAVHHPVFPVFREKALRGLEKSAVISDIFTQQEYLWISLQGYVQGLHNRLSKRQLSHRI